MTGMNIATIIITLQNIHYRSKYHNTLHHRIVNYSIVLKLIKYIVKHRRIPRMSMD